MECIIDNLILVFLKSYCVKYKKVDSYTKIVENF